MGDAPEAHLPPRDLGLVEAFGKGWRGAGHPLVEGEPAHSLGAVGEEERVLDIQGPVALELRRRTWIAGDAIIERAHETVDGQGVSIHDESVYPEREHEGEE